MIHKYKAPGMSHLIDDFFFIDPPNSDRFLHDVLKFEKKMCQTIGIPIKKCLKLLPTTRLSIYGIEVDSVKMESRPLMIS